MVKMSTEAKRLFLAFIVTTGPERPLRRGELLAIRR